ncbi:MAG: helix-turn-helix domain-containing protein [Erythrobacter sp.]|nr:helix-turn-helix domain-containing protein [Erythrobacter sp.]
MKRRAGVSTDLELARFMGVGHSTVSNWRQRGAVPEAAILKFEKAMSATPATSSRRALYARAIAMSLPEHWFRTKPHGVPRMSRDAAYLSAAMSFNAIAAEAARRLLAYELEHGVDSDRALHALFDDMDFMEALLEWFQGQSHEELTISEMKAIEDPE